MTLMTVTAARPWPREKRKRRWPTLAEAIAEASTMAKVKQWLIARQQSTRPPITRKTSSRFHHQLMISHKKILERKRVLLQTSSRKLAHGESCTTALWYQIHRIMSNCNFRDGRLKMQQRRQAYPRKAQTTICCSCDSARSTGSTSSQTETKKQAFFVVS